MNNNSNSDCTDTDTDTDTDTRTLAEKFYIDVMGMTPDKSKSFHVNLGRQQFHLAYPKKDREDEIPHRIHGSIGIAVPDINTLKERLIEAKKNKNSHGDGNGDGDKGTGNRNDSFCNTLFDFYEEKECYDIDIDTDTDTDTDDNTNSPTYYKVITVRCPWGNVFRCYSAYDRGRPTVLSSSSLSSMSLSTSPSSLSSILPSPQKMTNLHSLQIGMHGQDKMGVLCEGQPGIRFIELLCPYGSSDKVFNFYRKVLQCSCYCTSVSSSSSLSSSSNARSPSHCRNVRQNTTTACCIVSAGPGIHLVFVEEDEEEEPKLESEFNRSELKPISSSSESASALDTAAYNDNAATSAAAVTTDRADNGDVVTRMMKGVHICIYVHDFKGLYNRLSDHSLIWTNPRFTRLDSCDTWKEAKRSRTLRFRYIIDINDNDNDQSNKPKILMELEHETRPIRHGQFMKVPYYVSK